MKKFWMLALVLIIAISISACGSKAQLEEPKQTQETQKPEENLQESNETAEEGVETSKPESQEDSNNDNKGSIDESTSSKDAAYRIPDFQSMDFDGNEITNKFFADNMLTVVNVWTTTCPSCIEEIPVLQEIEEKYKDKGVRVLAILADNEVDAAKKILELKGGKYRNIITTESLIEGFLEQIMYVPTTLLVNSKGELIGEVIAGARSTEEFSKLIDDALKGL
ncbi:TlpA disulfide reductase family protein [Lutispora thermophila]|uniref:Thiol-disulfide isomerase or thioredoxin n=1 Tax=Lutispora thermophila DSM 19022 TaxID=1122184 RepID=A0A1M6FX99_9FIRM|nr:TlpA disulfide reductase family protein [Lutispora thermophila]SHJ02292.1 Thiol-disulfide isomerase or thioredoxin [Lutispora thermophila DSM 19022]